MFDKFTHMHTYARVINQIINVRTCGEWRKEVRADD